MFEKERKKGSTHPVLYQRESKRLIAQSLCGQPKTPEDRKKHKLLFFEVENSILSPQQTGWEGSLLSFSSQKKRNKEIWQVHFAVCTDPDWLGHSRMSSLVSFQTAKKQWTIFCRDM